MVEPAKKESREDLLTFGEFGEFSEDRLRIDRIIERLDVTDDLSERADLGSELVRALSRFEDTFERVLRPRLVGPDSDHLLDEQDRDREELRQVMDEIHQRPMGIDPRNVHASDGQGFEVALAAVVAKVRTLVVREDREVADVVASLDSPRRQELADEVINAHRSASERPRPPRTTVGRFLSNAHVKLDHTFEDVATPHHPGADTVDG
jgi:hypothetical protein